MRETGGYSYLRFHKATAPFCSDPLNPEIIQINASGRPFGFTNATGVSIHGPRCEYHADSEIPNQISGTQVNFFGRSQEIGEFIQLAQFDYLPNLRTIRVVATSGAAALTSQQLRPIKSPETDAYKEHVPLPDGLTVLGALSPIGVNRLSAFLEGLAIERGLRKPADHSIGSLTQGFIALTTRLVKRPQ